MLAARDGPNLVTPHLIEIAGSERNSARKGTIAHQAAQVDKTALSFMAAFGARFGFRTWAPDLQSTPYSLYNSACRIVAIFSFQQAMLAHAYAFLGPVFKYVQDMGLMIKLYDHFVFFIQLRRFLKNSDDPGIVAIRESRKNNYQRRGRVSSSSLAFTPDS